MSWNRGNSRNERGGRNAAAERKPRVPLVLLVPLALAVIAAGVWLAVRGVGARREAPEGPLHRPAGKIVEAVPAVASVAEPADREKAVEVRKLDDGRYMKYVDGKRAWMYPRKSIDPPARTNGQNRALSIEQRIFKYRADMEIAGLLMMHLGDMAIGDPEYDKWFERDFLKSFADPEFLLAGDTEEERALKKAVTEVKAELKARYDAGESLSRIMKEARAEMRELGAYKADIEREVRRLAKDGELSAEDIEDLVAAANKMLGARGIAPMKMSGFLRHQLKLRSANATAEGGKGEKK